MPLVVPLKNKKKNVIRCIMVRIQCIIINNNCFKKGIFTTHKRDHAWDHCVLCNNSPYMNRPNTSNAK